jgi:uncharacterized protein (DUF58 family)
MAQRLTYWLETHWINPAYSGWVLGGLSFFFFVAATNTLAGWLYVLSGLGFALLTISAYLPRQALQHLKIQRLAIEPVSAGDYLTLELILVNRGSQVQNLLLLQDNLPANLGPPVNRAIAHLSPKTPYHWIYYAQAPQRGVYRWHQVELRTAAPLGLCWYRRSLPAQAKAIVYPTVLPLATCPIMDQLGRERDPRFQSQQRSQLATEGITRTLRPYRWGDSTRLIHWRTSARYGELRVRELEVFQGGQDIILGLDYQGWQPEAFEQAVITAASLYFYGGRSGIPVQLWTGATGLVHGNRTVLETLAGVQAHEPVHTPLPINQPLIWLSQNPESLALLSENSRWLLWSLSTGNEAMEKQPTDRSLIRGQGLHINNSVPLQSQLQTPLSQSLTEA